MSKAQMFLRPASLSPAPASLAFLIAAATVACGGSAGDDQGSGLHASFASAPPAAAADVVFLRPARSDGSLVSIDVVGRDVSAPLDGLHVVIAFDRAVVEPTGVSGSTFLGTCGRTRPQDNVRLLCVDNISNGAASQSGVLLLSVVPQGVATPTVVSGDTVLTTVTFRGIARGSSPVFFHDAANPAPGGGSVSEVTSATDPAGAAAVAFFPDASGTASIDVERAR